ncbi:MAG: hypothetical protein ACM4AI_04665 [Acidobacteriota bacterium]
MRPQRLAFVAAGIVTLGMMGAADGPTTVEAIQTSPPSRMRYLARATIWREPTALSPADVLEGPSGGFPYTFEQATGPEGIGCTFTQAGQELGGNTPKFLCRTADGHNLRLKYWDPQSHAGNREVFSTVAASRLMWALGFDAVPAQPMNVRCDGCPDNPETGEGTRRTRRYVAMMQALRPTPVILSTHNVDQGWSWRELDAAIRSLPAGPERLRQRTYFDALTLLGVFMQHGDRKPEQQRLYCAGAVSMTAGELRDPAGGTTLLLVERPGASACPTSAVTIADAGATFGGAGRLSSSTTATMNRDAWQRKPVFRDAGRPDCHGDLTVSLKAGGDGEPNPVISEEGRRFLLEQLHRLTPDHVRALFRAARVDQLGDAPRADRSTGDLTVVDAWVAVFQDKVQQIGARRCQPAS